jgi:YHS domain-containing protein
MKKILLSVLAVVVSLSLVVPAIAGDGCPSMKKADAEKAGCQKDKQAKGCKDKQDKKACHKDAKECKGDVDKKACAKDCKKACCAENKEHAKDCKEACCAKDQQSKIGNQAADKDGKVLCPVMGGEIVLAKADQESAAVYKGKTYYFCCAGCKPQFEKDPEKYLKK